MKTKPKKRPTDKVEGHLNLQAARKQLKIVVDLIPVGNSNRPGVPLEAQKITIHNTDNPSPGADARAHAAYLKGPDARARQVSWHFTVDDYSIYQSLPVNEIGWHAGTHKGNYTSIGIEICENQGIDQMAANDLAAQLTAVQLHELGISLDGNVVQHHDWSGKDCPYLLRHPSSGWENFVDKVTQYYEGIQLDGLENRHGEPVTAAAAYARFSVTGRMSTFGGPDDPGVGPGEDTALVYNTRTFQQLRDYFLPQQPPGTTGYAKRLDPSKFYLACRWDYDVTPQSDLRAGFATLTNPRNGKSALAKPIDYGPNERTGRDADLSPGLADYLGLTTEQIVSVVFV